MKAKRCKCGKTLLEGETKCENCKKKKREKIKKVLKVAGSVLGGIAIIYSKFRRKKKEGK